MGTNEELVPGELLRKLPERDYRVKQNFKFNCQAIYMGLNKKINEEIAHV